jgi:hypothetical protein
VRITVARSGGFASFPGLEQPVTIDTASLEPAEAAALEKAVRDARFADLPPQVGSRIAGAADYRTYQITVDDGQRANTVCVVEPIADPALQHLVSRLEQQRRRTSR